MSASPVSPIGSQGQPAAQPPGPQPKFEDPYAERRARLDAWREQRRAMHGSNRFGWVGGVILILLGGIFLLGNLGLFYVTNWWALFILIPAFAILAGGWDRYTRAGRLTGKARAAFICGILLLLLAVALLFNLTWGLTMPLLLIVAGVALLVNTMLPD